MFISVFYLEFYSIQSHLLGGFGRYLLAALCSAWLSARSVTTSMEGGTGVAIIARSPPEKYSAWLPAPPKIAHPGAVGLHLREVFIDVSQGFVDVAHARCK